MPVAGKKPAKEAGAGFRTAAEVGLSYLCGGLTEGSLRHAGCIGIFPGPVMRARFGSSLLAR